MARAAYPQNDPQDFGQSPGEWQALRGELVALLDQVESQVSRQPRQDTGYQNLSERMRDLRMQVEEVEPDTRHREALRSVKRAIDRLSDREEVAYQTASSYSERPAAPNPRDTLQSAIQQIRARHQVDVAPQQPAPAPAPQQRFLDLPQFTEMAQAVGGISGRLERLEGELRNQARNQTGNVKDIAEQVAQLSHVVELLAGAVGETGQVKRLEGQIASLAKMVAQGPQVDLSSLNKRLDDVSMTVGKLADLQVQYANKVANTDKSAEVVDSVHSMGNSMRAIEEGVRHVYDRIDTIERQTGLAPADLEPITQELSRITEAMAHPNQPQGLVELIDALNSRIADIENRAPAVSDLKLDVAELRAAVIEAMEPRFAAIELQIESLSDRIPSKADSHEFNIGLLESQVRQLVARMDQTSEQLTVLAKAYQQPPAVAPDFDFEALADLVASRTSDALVRVDQPAPAMSAAETDYEEIEKRLAKVMRAAATQQPPAEDLSTMRSGISEVNERLARLEQSLTARAEESKRIEAAPLADFTPPPPAREARPLDPIAEVIESYDVPPMAPLPPKRSDAMPANPATDAPLTAKPFPDAGPVRMALEAKNGPRKHHPGLSDGSPSVTPVAPSTPSAPPVYDPAVAAKPPRPVSSFDNAAEPFASPTPIAPVATPAPAEMPAAEVSAPSANTFIQAHRRAARQGATPTATSGKAEPVADTAPTSLIGRALARFQSVTAPAETKAAEPARERKGVPNRKLAGDKQPRGEAWTPEEEAKDRVRRAEIVAPPVADAAAEDDAAPESFLTRYRRPILLAAVLVAATILAANLILQRVAEEPAPAPETPAAETVSEVAPGLLDAQPMEQQTSGLSTASRVIEMVDSLKTGSIDPMSTRATAPQPMAFAPATATPDLSTTFGTKPDTTGSVPAAVDATTDAIKPPVDGVAPLDMPAPLALPETAAAPVVTSPVKVEMPPEALGPQELRQAAANGDPRAQFEVAAIYTEGRAVPEDLGQAAVWYERAAAQGFAPAQYRLGNLYENGRGVTKDLQQARLWYQRAAEAGNRMSMHNLAALYAGGELGKQEFDAASEWFEQAASRGMKDSQFNLGMLYARGLGVKQDMLTSYKWFSLAAERGDKDAAKARDDIARSLSPDDMSRLNAEIAAWKPQVVDMAANYAPIGTWSAKFDPGETITKKEVVLNVQAALSQLGYDTGTPDGVAGPKTAEAIKSFERATGMNEVGAINPRLLAVLGSQPV
jgi:localization factor PodJL